MRTGLPNDFSKLNRAHPGPRCFGSHMIQPLRTGAGNPIEIASNVQSCNSDLSSVTSSRGVISGPDLNFRRCAREIITFTLDPPISMTRILFFTASPISSLLWHRFRRQPQLAPAGPHGLFFSNHQALSCARRILPAVASAPACAGLRPRVLSGGTVRPAPTRAPSHDHLERPEEHH